MKKGEFIFIGGTGRSGTTILSKFLASDKQLTRLPYELRLHSDPNGLYDLYRNLTLEWDVYRGSQAALSFKKFYYKLLEFSFNSYHNIKFSGLSKSEYKSILSSYYKNLGIRKEKRLWIGNSPFLSKAISLFSNEFAKKFYPIFFSSEFLTEDYFFRQSEIFYKNIFEKELSECKYLIEHTPYNFLFFKFLNDIFPNSKFIHIKRNPFDIISSYSKQNWGSRSLNRNAKQIIALYKKWSYIKQDLNNYLEISLEDLSTKPDKTAMLVNNYLESNTLSYNYDLIDHQKLHLNRWKKEESLIRSLPSFKELSKCSEDLGYEN